MKLKKRLVLILLIVFIFASCAALFIFGIPAGGQLIQNIIDNGLGYVIATFGLVYVLWTCVLPVVVLVAILGLLYYIYKR